MIAFECSSIYFGHEFVYPPRSYSVTDSVLRVVDRTASESSWDRAGLASLEYYYSSEGLPCSSSAAAHYSGHDLLVAVIPAFD